MQKDTHTSQGGRPLVVRSRPQPWRWVGTALVALLAAMLINAVVTNPNFQWNVVAQYLTADTIVQGLLKTLLLTALAMLIGLALGTLLAVMRGSDAKILSGAAGLYIWFFRGTPLLVQLIFWFNLSSLYPQLGLGVPFGPAFMSQSTNALISPFTAALLGLGLNQAAYTAEIVRAGILSIPRGQLDAASSLGMVRGMTMRRVILPQAMRVIVPPVGNETIGMLKTTSIVSILAMPELLYSAQIIYSRTYQTMPLLLVASIWYLLVTSVLTLIQGKIERHFSRGSAVQVSRTARSRDLLRHFRSTHASVPQPGEAQVAIEKESAR